MTRRILARLPQEDLKFFELVTSKFYCAKQNVSLSASADFSTAAAEEFYREAFFALADAQYLLDGFWREVAGRHNLAEDILSRAFIDFSTGELWLEEN
ncbi:MAG: hypothetical protein LBJ25_01065 [Candidatus Margulisbacteria bacterium]|jgi:hypothetical protein|nr:hypothetical protein [Candidatus Margulisiibacteriota bacterium]